MAFFELNIFSDSAVKMKFDKLIELLKIQMFNLINNNNNKI